MTDEDQREIENEVRRILSKEVGTHREFLERTFKLALAALGLMVSVAAGLFVFLIGQSANETRTLIATEAQNARATVEREVGQRVLEYRISEDLRKRMAELAAHALETSVEDSLQQATLNELIVRAVGPNLSAALATLPCEKQAEECICRTDSGDNKAKAQICISRCSDGRLAALRIAALTATSKSVSCGQVPAQLEFF